tara:strand:- start:1070 stop:1870 length:801 start_codon:yes stop_codon:yes gene_type:complete
MKSMAHILMKFGGGLITTKSKMKTVDEESIEKLSKMVFDLHSLGHKVTIVHGAGSFGHLKAKEWRIAEGAITDILQQQKQAVKSIRMDMLELNRAIVTSLDNQNIRTTSFPPSDWATEVGPDFLGDLSAITNCNDNVVPITFGDVVDCKEPKLFGILSGDDLMVRIGNEIPDISHCIFLLGDTEGLLSAPPNDPNATLVEVWDKSKPISGNHDKNQDVTGGIFLKLQSASMICDLVPNVWFIDGREPGRVLELLETGTTRGTQIVS